MFGIGKIKTEFWTKAAICFGLSLLAILITQFFPISFIENIELNHIDDLISRRGEINIKDSASVIILEITQDTYDAIPPPYNAFPWPRTIFKKVIENLSEAGVKAIGIDVLLSNPDRFDEQNDVEFLETLNKYNNVVLSGRIVNIEGDVGNSSDSEIYYEVKKSDDNFSNYYYPRYKNIGIVQVVSDNDAVVRRYLPFMYASSIDSLLPTFGYALLAKYFELHDEPLAKNFSDHFQLYDRIIPKFDKISSLIYYYGSNRSFKHIDLKDVLDDSDFITKEEIEYETDINTWDDPDIGLKYQNIFKDKIVLIGSTMPEDKDIVPISFSKGEKKGDNLLYGVELHANAIQNVISRNFIYKQSQLVEIIQTIFLVFLFFFISSLLKELKTKYGLILEAVNLILVLGVVFVALKELTHFVFQKESLLISYTPYAISILLGYVSSTAYYFITERKQKTMIKGMFSQYVNATIVDELIDDPDKLRLGGERKNLTVFFSDIAGFSTFSENKEPEELINFLNEYLSEMTKVVFETKGTLDKYVGDAVMAFWGAPISFSNHAEMACRAALQMQRKIRELQEKWKQEGQPLIESRMGINTGDMVVGNVGGSQKFDYTVMGDNVNLASRLEGANKAYGTHIMISESTYEEVKNLFITRELDAIVVKGRTKPVIVYELIAEKEETLSKEKEETLEIFKSGITAYKERNFSKAIEYFTLALNVNPTDGPSKVYLERCQFYLENPPDENWDGVFVMKTK